MTDLPQPWCAYARLQSELSESRYINDRSWGNEVALNCFLVSDPKNMPQVGDVIVGLGAFGPEAFRLQDRRADRLNENSEATVRAVKSGRVVRYNTQLIRHRRVVRQPV